MVFNPVQSDSTLDSPVQRLVMCREPSSHVAECFRTVRGTLLRSMDQGVKSLLISSPWPREGKSIICANMSVAIAQVEKRTILVDGDLRRPTVSYFFGLDKAPGLGEALENPDISVTDLLHPTEIAGFSVLPAGAATKSPPDLMIGDRIKQVLRELGDVADCVLIDSPPLTFFAEGLRLASLVHGLVLIINPQRWRGEEELQLKKSLQETGARILGVVFNGSEDGDTDRSYYNYATYRSYRKKRY